MKRIGDLSGALASIDEARRKRRAARIDRYGWSADVTCSECGDTGIVPDAPRERRGCDACERGRDRVERERRERLYLEQIPRRFQGYRLDSHPNTEAVEDARAWIESYEPGDNLMILGPVGSGKTGLAYGIMRDLIIEHGIDTYAGNVVDILDSLRPRDKNDTAVADPVTVNRLVKVPMLILDDLAAEKPTEFTADRMYAIINGRYMQERGTIFTTNASIPQISTVYGGRVLSRIMERVQVIELTGRDLRRVKQHG